MNLHPIFVHFPVALLTIYTLLELIWIKKIRALPYVFYIKAFLVIVGGASTVTALITGELIKRQFASIPGIRPLVHVHSNFAIITTTIFIFLAVLYVIAWINKTIGVKQWFETKPLVKTIWPFLTKIEKMILETPLIIFFALLGLTAVTITGALGGAIAYGPDIDPVVNFVYHLLVR